MTEKEKVTKGISRREFLRDAGLLVGGTAIGSTVLLAACGGGEEATKTVTQTRTVTTTLTESRFVCSSCGTEFDTLAELQAHTTVEHPGEQITQLNVNGELHHLRIEPNWTLLKVLTEIIGLTGTKLACDRGHCGSCTVLMEGNPVLACTILAIECEGKQIETIEGLSDGATLHPMQQVFIDNYGFQCGFCIPGILMSTKALLDVNSNPSEDEVKKALSGNICKCGHYPRIISSVLIAAGQMGGV